MRNNILKLYVRRKDYNDKDMLKCLFLLLKLENRKKIFYSNNRRRIDRMYKKVKKKSTISIYSKRAYVLWKYVLTSKRLTIFVITFYNMLILNQYFSIKRIKVLYIILEKEKANVKKIQNNRPD